MLTIHDRRGRREYWADYWAEVGRDVDDISSKDVYPLYPADAWVRPGDVILEAGVGMGRVMKHYRRRGHRVVGMDYEPDCIQRLKQQDPTLPLYVGDVNQLPEPDITYDVVLAFGTLSNMPDPRQGLRELHRVLKPNGRLVASVTNDNVARRIAVAAGSWQRGTRHFSMMAYSPREWRGLLSAAGFEVLELAPVVTRLPLFTFFPPLRHRSHARLNWHTARDGDKGIRLNTLGEFVFRNAFHYVPFSISHGVVGVARKPA